jgi:hypothetical protein
MYLKRILLKNHSCGPTKIQTLRNELEIKDTTESFTSASYLDVLFMGYPRQYLNHSNDFYLSTYVFYIIKQGFSLYVIFHL